MLRSTYSLASRILMLHNLDPFHDGLFKSYPELQRRIVHVSAPQPINTASKWTNTFISLKFCQVHLELDDSAIYRKVDSECQVNTSTNCCQWHQKAQQTFKFCWCAVELENNISNAQLRPYLKVAWCKAPYDRNIIYSISKSKFYNF